MTLLPVAAPWSLPPGLSGLVPSALRPSNPCAPCVVLLVALAGSRRTPQACPSQVSPLRVSPCYAAEFSCRRPQPCGVERSVREAFGPPLSTYAPDATLLRGGMSHETVEGYIRVSEFRDARTENSACIRDSRFHPTTITYEKRSA